MHARLNQNQNLTNAKLFEMLCMCKYIFYHIDPIYDMKLPKKLITQHAKGG